MIINSVQSNHNCNLTRGNPNNTDTFSSSFVSLHTYLMIVLTKILNKFVSIISFFSSFSLSVEWFYLLKDASKFQQKQLSSQNPEGPLLDLLIKLGPKKFIFLTINLQLQIWLKNIKETSPTISKKEIRANKV